MSKFISALALGLSVTACGVGPNTSETKRSILPIIEPAIDPVMPYSCLVNAVYSRTVIGNGVMGSPVGEFHHQLSFNNDWTVLDNGSSFFGNPPSLEKYTASNYEITIGTNVYTLSEDCETLSNDLQTFVRVKN